MSNADRTPSGMLNIKTLEYQTVVSQLGNLPTENFIFSYTLQAKQNTAYSVILRRVRARQVVSMETRKHTNVISSPPNVSIPLLVVSEGNGCYCIWNNSSVYLHIHTCTLVSSRVLRKNTNCCWVQS